ncbi:hypothetical protein FRB94_004259 [Tulasnella sp. JGI-2019a]|nr:hypothetical protein FRB93_000260 [Tulasnella sp. JGI-2019a]KAG9015140.1 hypothetical protein FRB94_004259 [Tulasnella sp. JGI-2019a]
MRHSIGPNGYDKLYTAITCLFLASKVEESTRKLKDVAQVCYLKKYPKADPNNMQEADKWQDRIQTFEPIVLEALCFDLSVSHPHEYLAEAFSGGTRDAHTWEWKGRLANFSMIPRGLYQLAWSVVNDSLRIPLCLFYRPNLIASAAYLIAYTVIEGTQTTASNLSQSSSFSQAEVLTPPDEDGRGVSAADSNLTTGELSEGIANTIHQQSNDEHIVTDSTSGGNMTDDVPIQTPTVILDMDVLISTLVAGPWIQAFSIEEVDLKDLRDVVGNLLEFYQAVQNLGDISRIHLPQKYDSLSGVSQTPLSRQPIATSNSSPALTLTSNTTPMHGLREDSTQEYSSSAPRPEESTAMAGVS